MCFILNIYLDDQQTILKYLKNTEVNLNNVLIITVNFNIRDSNWNLLYPHYSTYANVFQEAADSLNLDLSIPINPVSAWYADSSQDSNLVLDLMFLQEDMKEFNNYHILSDLWNSSNHTSLLVSIIIKEEFIQERKQSIVRNIEKKRKFIDELRNKISNVDITNILNLSTLLNVLKHGKTRSVTKT